MDISRYLDKYDLKDAHIYLLELIPVIEMIWADGKNQEKELKILYQFTVEHLCRISKNSEGVEVVAQEDIYSFVDRFTRAQPSQEMLSDLRQLCIEKLAAKPEDQRKETTGHILSYCMDIAAACVNTYPYKFNERIVEQEKKLLIELIAALNP